MIAPKFSTEAIEEIKLFWVGIRNEPNQPKSERLKVPGLRDLAKLKKSAEEYAKARNSEIVEKEDAKKAIGAWKKEF